MKRAKIDKFSTNGRISPPEVGTFMNKAIASFTYWSRKTFSFLAARVARQLQQVSGVVKCPRICAEKVWASLLELRS